MRWNVRSPLFVLVALTLIPAAPLLAQHGIYNVGVARIDITPEGPIRLSNSGSRTGESEGVEQRIWAKALAISTTDDDVTVLVTVDASAIPGELVDDLANKLRDSGVTRDRLAVCVTQTHAAPWISGTLPNLFPKDLPPDQLQRVNQYVEQLKVKLTNVVQEALIHQKPAKLAWGEGKAAFGANRRTPGGPVDNAVPLLRVTDATDGKLVAVFLNFACPGTALPEEYNRVSGDWPGFAAEAIERDSPAATAMIALGCGADTNPKPRSAVDLARSHGTAIAAEVKRLLSTELRPLTAPITSQFRRIDLAFDGLPSKAKWTELAKRQDAVGSNARKYLARIDRGEKISADLPYTLQTWTFGNQLGMVFLSGDVVVDYSLRLKTEFDPAKLWVNAFCNDVTCIIPSRRILAEGGYEAANFIPIYGLPGKFGPGVENDIIRTVHAMLPDKLRTDQQRADYPRPKLPAEAIDRIRLRSDLKIDLVAAEPLVKSPIAIDWGNDGKLWVAEMIDFPTGLHENGAPGGRIVFLEDTDGDGKYDKSTVFLDGLKCPSGVMAWRKGVIICAAPDVIYAEDTNGDGRADIRKVLFSGFSADNEQWLLSSPTWGLDNWIYCASSGRNDSVRRGTTDKRIALGNRDFRFNPDSLDFEPVSGHSQWGLARDDWGNWFGTDKSNLIFHFPLPSQYARHNPNVAPPDSAVNLAVGADSNLLFPSSRTLKGNADPAIANRVTSACGLGIYRDEALGEEFAGNSFTCEPAHNLVRRMVLKPKGLTYTAERATDEKDREFLTSSDAWFRPVQARTGPDGALWVVDMYRFVIDRARSKTPERLNELDIRAGADMGRIYRVFPRNHRPDAIRSFADEPTAIVAKLLDSTNGTLRDAVHRELYQRKDAAAVPVLREIALTSEIPAARAQALCALDSFDGLAPDLVEDFLRDPSAQVRATAVRLSEPWMTLSPSLIESLDPLINDPEIGVRYQLALSLGVWPKLDGAASLARLAAKDLNDPYIRAAVLSSSVGRAVDVLTALRGVGEPSDGRDQLVRGLVATACASREGGSPSRLMLAVLPSLDVDITPADFRQLAALLDEWPDDILGKPIAIDPGAASRVERLLDAARSAVEDPKAPADRVAAAALLLGREPKSSETDLTKLETLLRPQSDAKIRAAVLAALNRKGDARRKRLFVAGGDEQTASAVINPPPAADRDKVIALFAKAAQLKGDAAHGGAIFNQVCASCHALSGAGHAVGPDLRMLTDKSPEALLRSILDPNALIDQGYAGCIVQPINGPAISGIIADETATSITLLQPKGIRSTILRKDLKSVQASKASLMPEGLEKGLSAQDLADLIRFVQDGK